MKYKIDKQYYDKENRDFAIVYINNKIIEDVEHWAALKQYFLKSYNINDESKIDDIMDNKDKDVKLSSYAMASKKENKIIVLYDSIENIDISDLYKKLKRKYPKHQISFNSQWYKAAELEKLIC
jgi:hypothetical protein